MDEWNRFLEANREQIRDFGDIPSIILLLKENIQPTVCLLTGFEDGDSIAKGIKSILKDAKPDSYIFACLGWGTTFGEKVLR